MDTTISNSLTPHGRQCPRLNRDQRAESGNGDGCNPLGLILNTRLWGRGILESMFSSRDMSIRGRQGSSYAFTRRPTRRSRTVLDQWQQHYKPREAV